MAGKKACGKELSSMINTMTNVDRASRTYTMLGCSYHSCEEAVELARRMLAVAKEGKNNG